MLVSGPWEGGEFTFLLEIKSKYGKVTPSQQEFALRWRGALLLTRATTDETLVDDLRRQIWTPIKFYDDRRWHNRRSV